MNLTKTERRQDRRETPDLTGLPVQLKRDFEARSGLSFDDVRVHYRSDRPAGLGALAYTQGNQVYLGPGQERHLPHELAHVAQQKQGRVGVETLLGGVPLNLDPALEAEADRFSAGMSFSAPEAAWTESSPGGEDAAPIQMRVTMGLESYLRKIRGIDPANPVTLQNAQDYLSFCGYEKELELIRSVLGDDNLDYQNLNQDYANITGELAHFESEPPAFREKIRIFLRHSYELYCNADTPGGENQLRDAQYKTDPARLTQTLAQTRTRLHELAHPAAGAAPVSTEAPLNAGSSRIPVLAFTKVQGVVPPELGNLMRDIYLSWKLGQVFDRRSPAERRGKSTASDTPGALRSYHMNVQGSLPSPINPLERRPAGSVANFMGRISEDDVTQRMEEEGSPAKRFHAYYQKHSQMEAGARLHQAGNAHPVGYAEYTGIAFSGAPHDCKIVLDYIRGWLYLTLTHYQYYQYNEGAGGEIVPRGTNYDSAPFNPWFRIDMTR